MIPRTALRRVARPGAPLSQTTSIRSLSYVSVRPSAIALGKRPAAAVPLAGSSFASARQFSWTPWASSAATTPVANEPAVASTSTSAPIHEPILSESHPDLTSTTSVPVETPLPDISSTVSSSGTSSMLSPADAALLPQPPANAFTPSLEDLILNSGKPLEEVLNSQEAIHAVMKVSDLKLMGYEHGMFSISGWFTDAIVAIHTYGGLPWWATIASITVAIRLALAPLLIKSQKHNVRLAAVNPQIQSLMEKAQEARAKNDLHAQTVVGQAMRQLMKENNVNPARALILPAIQLPIFFTFFSIMRGLTNLPVPQFKEGGIAWFTDLTMADPYYILPLTSLVFTNLVFKYGADGVGGEAKAGSPQRMAHMRNFVQLTTLLSLPVVAYFPAAILCYWTFSSGFTLLQSLILRQHFVKRLLGIPIPPKITPPPGTPVQKDPSYADTFRAIRGWWTESIERTQTQNAIRQQELATVRRQERIGGAGAQARPGQGSAFVERIKEEGVAPSAAPVQQASSTVRRAAPVAPSRVVDSRQSEKQRRIAAAREKRSSR
ncbi:hypothetical protein CI109_104788 [Kwoniella shandongensis]|uniref:Uncharacterized protein n=1 Tax=Kwoniella shandongensis TaxID=1734106 RepID=A0A5M6BT44_9TREE|nr:uncharacterized protein CI109_006873 [Kwoniella shandongensis]KAA5524785.1 hypothetical protein CI109_006873 [Kwoniella shandongensis]